MNRKYFSVKFWIIGLLFTPVIIVSQQGCIKKENKVNSTTPSTGKVPVLPDVPYNYSNTIYPPHIQAILSAFDNTPADNPITDDGATLGRVLFYDKNLSANNSTACANCHKQSLAFTDGLAKSTGHTGEQTRRNSMSLLNLRFYPSGKMFWDERVSSLEEQVLKPIQDSIEMGMNLNTLLIKLNGLSYYKPLFNRAFGSHEITVTRISKALSQFLRSIVTYRSKYDLVRQGLAAFTTQEQAGNLFFNATGPQAACIGCHGGGGATNEFQQAVIPIKNPPEFNNVNDFGLFETTHSPGDSARFKISSLRNVVHTAPYMHNGSVANLQDLFNVNYHKFQLTQSEKNNIIAYLNTLTDNEVLTDVKFADPFK